MVTDGCSRTADAGSPTKRVLIVSTSNILSPANGGTYHRSSQDVVLVTRTA